jgi:hypothetical protein
VKPSVGAGMLDMLNSKSMYSSAQRTTEDRTRYVSCVGACGHRSYRSDGAGKHKFL